MNINQQISNTLNINLKFVDATLKLINEGATVPFMARYRKEATGGLDELQIIKIKDSFEQLSELENRRAYILKTIEEQGNLSVELKSKIEKATTITELEDIYLPFKPKRKTKATLAKEKGLEPLANIILEQKSIEIKTEAAKFINIDLSVKTIEEAITGAKDIIAEIISENEQSRNTLRNLFTKESHLYSQVKKGKKEEGEKFKDYFDWHELAVKSPGHRVLAMFRGEEEGFLNLSIHPNSEEAIEQLNKLFIKTNNACSHLVKESIEDSYNRLLQPALESEFRVTLKKKADEEAIQVFADNVRELLLAAPLGQKRILAIDPGFRTGCKTVVLNEQGKLITDTVIYPHNGLDANKQAKNIVLDLILKNNIEAIAIGNGTAGRETESFVRSIEQLPKDLIIIMVNESGASIYSASEVARNEFPDKDITVRGAVSIGRRLADPLAELVKIDPKSIGVGQYQHDVDQKLLKKKLDEVVESAVNKVGVELNTASKELLTYVAGLGPLLAQNIVNYRNENGAFKTRKELLKVPRMGDKAFEQCAGFLRIRNAKNPLDASAVHPESYHIVEKIAKDKNCSIEQLVSNKENRNDINIKQYVAEGFGEFTLKDILQELEKPGRDPRKEFEIFEFDDTVNNIEDLKIGMKLPGIITNVTKFGAFVDIGVHQDGLVHISQLSDQFVSDPNQVVKVGQKVMVEITEVEISRKRIALSMKGQKKNPSKPIEKTNNHTSNNYQDSLEQLKNKFGKK